MEKYYISSFNIILLFFSIDVINSLNFFPTEKVKEEQSLNNSLLIFTIKGAVDSNIKQNISFNIEAEFYKDEELLSKNNYIKCTIQENIKAVFGTQITSKCEYDLFYSPLSNKIIFVNFTSDLNVLEIKDPNNYIIGNNFTFIKNIDIIHNFEFVVEELKLINCTNDEYIFGIMGEINNIFISGFTFNLTINQYSLVKAKCQSPYIYFTKKTMINCTISLLNKNEEFNKGLNKGIILKDNYYRIINEEGNKILKMKIGKNMHKIELAYNCDEIQDYNNSIINVTNITRDENNNLIKEKEKLEDNEKIIDNNKNDTNINNSKVDNDTEDRRDNYDNDIKISIIEKIDNKTVNEKNITEVNNTNITDNDYIENFNEANDTNKTDNINNYNDKNNITKDNITDNFEIDNNQSKINNTENNNTLLYNISESDDATNVTDINNKTDEITRNEITTNNITSDVIKDRNEEKESNDTKNIQINITNITINEKNNSLIEENNITKINLNSNFSSNNNGSNEINTTKKIEKEDIIINKNDTYENISKENNIRNETKNQTELEESNSDTAKTINDNEKKNDTYVKKGRQIFGKGINFIKIKNKTEIELEEKKQREWEAKKEEEKKRKKEEEEKAKEEERKRREKEELDKMIKEREEKVQNYIAEKERKEKEEKKRLEKEKEDNKRIEYLKHRDKNNYDENNNNSNKEIINKDNNKELIFQTNIEAKLIHLQFRYGFGTVYYMFYSLTEIPKNHQIKINLSISRYNDNVRQYKLENIDIILTTNQEIRKEDKNIIVEYSGSLDCTKCRSIILNEKKIEGAIIYNIPKEIEFRDAIINTSKNFVTISELKSPLLYITENISNKNCLINLEGNFFNKNKFFNSKFNLNFLGTYNRKNINVFCGLNERSTFSCLLNEDINNFEYKLEQFIIDKKENIIIDNSKIVKNNIKYYITCENKNDIKKDENNKKEDTLKNAPKTKSKKKKILIGIIFTIILLYCLISCCCNEKEPEIKYSSSSRVASISSSNYIGETSGLLNRRW